MSIEKIYKPDGSFQEYDKECPNCHLAGYVYYMKKGQHIGAYCIFCERWLDWVKQWTEKDWNKRIKERDHYTCQRCGKMLNGRMVQAHHKIPKWFMPELQFDLDNGITLCTACHKQLHGKGGTIKESEDKL